MISNNVAFCILTSVDLYVPLQPPLKLRNSKWCSVSSLTIIEYTCDFVCYMCFVVTCWERADLLALVCGVFCEFVTFPLVSWVRCGTWLYRFLIFATLLTLCSKGSDQTARMRRLIWGFAGRTRHIVGNLMPMLNYSVHLIRINTGDSSQRRGSLTQRITCSSYWALSFSKETVTLKASYLN